MENYHEPGVLRLTEENQDVALDNLEIPPHLKRLLITSHLCTRCGLTFRPCDNYGTWHCRQHLGVVDPMTDRYTCCNIHPAHEKQRGPRGCLPCDHSTSDSLTVPGTLTKIDRRFKPHAHPNQIVDTNDPKFLEVRRAPLTYPTWGEQTNNY